ncbi:MAG: DUF58 domain-containing protein, partial [Pyrinomonadaceae bacterium]
DFELSTRFPFGFFRHRRRLAARETELIVFPKLHVLGRELDGLPLEAGKLVANKRGSGQDLLALREYQPDDDPRRIDWKATARARHLIVREFSAEDEKRVTIYFDTDVPSMGEKVMTLREKIEFENAGKSVVQSERFEKGVSQTAALVAHFCNERADVRLVTANEKGEFGTGTRHLHDILKRLAVIEPSLADGNGSITALENIGDIFDETENSYNVLVTIINTAQYPDSLPLEANIVHF